MVFASPLVQVSCVWCIACYLMGVGCITRHSGVWWKQRWASSAGLYEFLNTAEGGSGDFSICSCPASVKLRLRMLGPGGTWTKCILQTGSVGPRGSRGRDWVCTCLWAVWYDGGTAQNPTVLLAALGSCRPLSDMQKHLTRLWPGLSNQQAGELIHC